MIMPYTADKPDSAPSAEELRTRIPGWGADLDPADRPSFPRERFDPGAAGAHWEFPDRQPDDPARERSIEHAMLTPVYGTAQPLHGVSGAIRRFAYSRFSEARAAHWLLLVLGDRVESAGAHVRSLFSARPDNPITETGVLAEHGHGPVRSRFGRGRIDNRHSWMDPLIVVTPWLMVAGVMVIGIRLVIRRRR
jgi:hypothetical protein